MNLWTWISTLFRMVATKKADDAFMKAEIKRLEEEIKRNTSSLGYDLKQLEQIIKDRTDLAVDVSPYGHDSCVILVGRYRNRDYVEIQRLDDQEFHFLIEQLRAQARYGRVRRVDGPPVLRQVLERERFIMGNDLDG